MMGDGGKQKKSKQEALNDAAMDDFPVELVGKILSQLVRARDIAVASVTCRKWRQAARSYIEKLSFDDSDWPKVIETKGQNSETLSSVRELLIVGMVMHTSCLKELAIRCNFKKSKMHAGMMVACLLHVKHTLKSFTLTSPLMPNVNLLERLAYGASVLEHLEWHHAYIPSMGTFANGFLSLKSLDLDTLVDGLSSEYLVLLLSWFPKLKHLSLKKLCIMKVPTLSLMELDICNLETLKMERISAGLNSSLVLLESKLGRLQFYIREFPSGRLHWQRREGNKSMQYLLLRGMHVAEFKVGEGLGHLELDDTDVPLLEIKHNLLHLSIEDPILEKLKIETLDSLIELKLSHSADFENAWRGAYRQIVSKVGPSLRRLAIRGCDPYKGLVDVDVICWAFPCLQALSMDYPNFYFNKKRVKLPVCKEMRQLKLGVAMVPEDCKPFIERFLGLLQRFPNVQSVIIELHVALTTEPFENDEFIGELSSLLIPILNSCPHMNVSFEFS